MGVYIDIRDVNVEINVVLKIDRFNIQIILFIFRELTDPIDVFCFVTCSFGHTG